MAVHRSKYGVGARLGGGGMAEVFEASMRGAEGFTRRVAIKRVLPGYSNNPTFAKMFIEEAQLSSRLAHPNIVSVLDFDRDAKGQLFLAMELVEGVDLHALVATGLLPFPVVIHVIAEVLRGLGYAHEVPLVHRDVSPHNVLLSWGGEVKVSDFGIAKARDATDATVSAMLKGKPAYMSPEQANGQPLDGRSDLFAVGVIMWELLTGRRLFAADDTRATLAAVLFGKIPRPRKLRPEVPKDLDRVVMRLLAREASERYQTADTVLQDLVECDDASEAGRDALVALLGARMPERAPAPKTKLLNGSDAASRTRSTTSVLRVDGARGSRVGRWRAIGLFVCATAIVGGFLVSRNTHRYASDTDAPNLASDAGHGVDAAVVVDAAYWPDAPIAEKRRVVEPRYIPPKCVAAFKLLAQLRQCYAVGERPEVGAGFGNELDELKSELVAVDDPAIRRFRAKKLVSIEETCQSQVATWSSWVSGCGDPHPVVAHWRKANPTDDAGILYVPTKCAAYVDTLDRVSKCKLLDDETRIGLARVWQSMKGVYRRSPGANDIAQLEAGCQSGLELLLLAHPGC